MYHYRQQNGIMGTDALGVKRKAPFWRLPVIKLYFPKLLADDLSTCLQLP